jgi:hypothetical protein
MAQNQVESIRPEILAEFMKLISPCTQVDQKGLVEWTAEVLGETTDKIPQDYRTVYFATKHIVLKEIEMALESCVDCQLFFTGEEQSSQPSQVTAHRRISSNSDAGRASIGAISNDHVPKNPVVRQKQPERVSKY